MLKNWYIYLPLRFKWRSISCITKVQVWVCRSLFFNKLTVSKIFPNSQSMVTFWLAFEVSWTVPGSIIIIRSPPKEVPNISLKCVTPPICFFPSDSQFIIALLLNFTGRHMTTERQC